jgi:hypothetical protein
LNTFVAVEGITAVVEGITAVEGIMAVMDTTDTTDTTAVEDGIGHGIGPVTYILIRYTIIIIRNIRIALIKAMGSRPCPPGRLRARAAV